MMLALCFKGKSHKMELKIIQPIISSQNPVTSYLWPQGHTHTLPHESF